ncbi:copper amine oxidase N-terminal domain-containing protein [Paenibacillus luteus]|uniref:copper amine oxidase N-terminal domain-containing protein n=1 Tax=Paenibacillus luteus TaxID=2545753 RepID=UPI001375F853|nr:copper amine oxidase N-terminal domain-containing protein [Paenibacillus luteus]
MYFSVSELGFRRSLRKRSNKIVVNGKTVAADVAPRMINNRVMVPISFVSKALGADVTWDQKTQTVGVKSYGIAPVDIWKVEEGKPSEFQVKVAVQTWTLDDTTTIEQWDLTVVQNVFKFK